MKQKVVHLNRYFHFTELMRDLSSEAQLFRYKSGYDGSIQSALILSPTRKKVKRVFFFFHGMDGDCGDGVIARNIVNGIDAKVVCMGGRGPSWISDAFVADAQQIIKKYSKGFQGFYLSGVSMGGSQALSLAGMLPPMLRNSVLGVIALIPCADFHAAARCSANRRVRNTLKASVNGSMARLKERSPVQLIGRYSKDLPFVIFYNMKDTLLLTGKTEEFISKLRLTHPVTSFTASGGHSFTYTNVDYKELFESLGKNSMVNKGIPIIENKKAIMY